MSESIDIKAGIKSIIDRIEVAVANRPNEVKLLFLSVQKKN